MAKINPSTWQIIKMLFRKLFWCPTPGEKVLVWKDKGWKVVDIETIHSFSLGLMFSDHDRTKVWVRERWGHGKTVGYISYYEDYANLYPILRRKK